MPEQTEQPYSSLHLHERCKFCNSATMFLEKNTFFAEIAAEKSKCYFSNSYSTPYLMELIFLVLELLFNVYKKKRTN